MRPLRFLPFLFVLMAAPGLAAQSGQAAPPPATPGQATQPKPSAPQSPPPREQKEQKQPPAASHAAPDPNAELRKAVQGAGNDRKALVRNLQEYLRRFPDAPAKASIYRALVESEIQLHDDSSALVYAERLIALQPDNAQMMLYAIRLLKEQGRPDGLRRAVDYATRVIDRVEKASPQMKPEDLSPQQWDASRKRLEMAVYLVRGQLHMDLKENDEAAADLDKSFDLIPNPEAALYRGEVAELQHQPDRAIDDYAAAFVLPDQQGSMVDRAGLRHKLGNLWVLRHGSEAGMGERLLRAYDEIEARKQAAAPAPVRNPGLTDPFAFVLRRPDGSAPYKLAGDKGKVVVLNFWATWCTPCLELAPLFDRVRIRYASRPDVVFLAVNGDEDESRVKPFLDRNKMGSAVVFADGLQRLLGVRTFPTVLVVGREGRVSYRAAGFDPATFAPKLNAAIDRALTVSK